MKSDAELKAQLRSAFIDEAWDHIQKIDSCFVCLEKSIRENQNVSGLVNDVFRSFHTM